MVAKVVEYFKEPENFSILMFLLYVIVLTHVALFMAVGLIFKQ